MWNEVRSRRYCCSDIIDYDVMVMCYGRMYYLVEGFKPRNRPKRTWCKVIERDMKNLQMNMMFLVNIKWRRLISGTMKIMIIV